MYAPEDMHSYADIIVQLLLIHGCHVSLVGLVSLKKLTITPRCAYVCLRTSQDTSVSFHNMYSRRKKCKNGFRMIMVYSQY